MRNLTQEMQWLTVHGNHDAAAAIARRLQEESSNGLARDQPSAQRVEASNRRLIRSGFARAERAPRSA